MDERGVSLLWLGPLCFYKDKQYEGPSKWNHSPSRNGCSRNNHEGSTHDHLVYPKDLYLSWVKIGSLIQSYQGS